MKHKHADLLRHAAENADARFLCLTSTIGDIKQVLEYNNYKWEIYKPDSIVVEYYAKTDISYFLLWSGSADIDIKRLVPVGWGMKITITNGDRKNAKVEFND
jgi:hypothetical protein